MPALLEPVELDRLTQEGVGDRLGVAERALASFSFGLYRDVPNRQTNQPFARFGLQNRPIDDGRLVAVMGVEQHPAKRRLVRLATGNDRSGFCCSPHPGSTIGSLDRRVIHHRRRFAPRASQTCNLRRKRSSRTHRKTGPFHALEPAVSLTWRIASPI